ncbi:MAG: hypothetical protein UIB61_11255 [Treponema sp.]|nr:hypothetical protein [Treponema sp.]
MKKLFTLTAAFFLTLNCFAKDRPIITNLEAAGTRGNKINLSWKVPSAPEPKIQQLFIYRNSKPIGSYYDISDSTLIATVEPDTQTFSDTVKNYNDYYYAIIAQVNNGKYDIILPSVNATVNGTHLTLPPRKQNTEKTESAKEKLVPIDGKRETPLPFLDITEQFSKKPIKMNEETKKIAESLGDGSKNKKQKRMEPYIFEEDIISPDGGDDFLLFEILRTTFIQKKYNDSAEQLKKLLGTNRSKEVTKRAVFYLGESEYYTKNYSDAVRTFLLVYDEYPVQAKKWIDATLDEMKPNTLNQ